MNIQVGFLNEKLFQSFQQLEENHIFYKTIMYFLMERVNY